MTKGWKTGFDFAEKPDRAPPGNRREHGGVKVTAVTSALGGLPDGRYSFRIEGEAPRSVVLTDISAMLEARFSGEVAVKLDASRELRIQEARKKYQDSATATGIERARLQTLIGEHENKKVLLEKEYQEKLGNVSAERLAVEQQIAAAKARLGGIEAEIKATERRMANLVVSDGAAVVLAPDAEEKIEALLLDWQQSLEDYDRPMPVEWSDLAARMSKLLSRVVAQTKGKLG